jgi:hypothetical protein
MTADTHESAVSAVQMTPKWSCKGFYAAFVQLESSAHHRRAFFVTHQPVNPIIVWVGDLRIQNLGIGQFEIERNW